MPDILVTITGAGAIEEATCSIAGDRVRLASNSSGHVWQGSRSVDEKGSVFYVATVRAATGTQWTLEITAQGKSLVKRPETVETDFIVDTAFGFLHL